MQLVFLSCPCPDFCPCPGVMFFCPCPVPDSGGVIPGRSKSKIHSWLFKPPKNKNQSKVIQAACKNKSVENQTIKKAADIAA
jgi:hypothetical protein